MGFSQLLQNIDQFRSVSRDLTRGSSSGSVFTLIAYVLILILLGAEIRSYFENPEYTTDVRVDQNSDRSIWINFDITIFDLPCKYIKVQVFDSFGEERLETAEAFNLMSIDHEGSFKGSGYNQDEIAALEKIDLQHDVTEDEKKDLDSDWSASSDHFKHQDFDAVVAFHDFTLVNFYAEWCGHCRDFHPTWMKASNQISEKVSFEDGDGKPTTVKMLKMNCVDFDEQCAKSQIAAFPTIRLYKRDGTFDSFNQKRSVDNINSFLTESIKNSHKIVAKHHSIFPEGCQVQGQLQVARVPGHFQVQAEPHGALNINPALTNVSHKVNHLSFNGKQSRLTSSHWKSWSEALRIPYDMVGHINPMDGRSFIVERFHEAPQHYLKVVRTNVDRGPVFYQMTHTARTRRLRMKEGIQATPQLRFTYDFSPHEVVLRSKAKRWYEFLVSLFAIIAGTYTITELACSTGVSVAKTLKATMGKES